MTTATATATKVTVRWNTFDNTDALQKDIMAQQPELSEDEAFRQACEDEDYSAMCWADMLDYLQKVLDTFNPDGYWYVTGHNMGWRHLEGYAKFHTDKAIEFLRKVLPNTDEFTFELTVEQDSLDMKISHHDAPTGEFRHCYKAIVCQECGEIFNEDEIKKDKGVEYCADYYDDLVRDIYEEE